MSFLIHQLVDHHARLDPERDAIRCLDRKMTYGELMGASNRLANCLIELGVARGDRVGIYMNKCLEVATALYGSMKAGAAYVPLDPSAPVDRTREIIEDCGIGVVVSANNKRGALRDIADGLSQPLSIVGPDPDENTVLVSYSWQQVLQQFPEQLPAVKLIESDLAYIIYTSGSTGKPKGIMHTHHSCLSFARWAVGEYQLTVDDRLSNHAPLHFDLSIFDYFAGAVAGSCTVIIPEEYTKLPASYSQLIADSGITVLFTVPFALIQLLLRGVLEQRDLSALRWLIFGGEPMPVKYLRELMQQLPGTAFDNMYGPAEVNGCSHYTIPVPPEGEAAIPIGKIAQIADALVVDEASRPVRPGEIGELLVRTPSMMRGYWNRPQLNQAAFFHLTPAAGPAQTFFRTGDLVLQAEEGTMWFMGRKDRQIKVRGYRIELDEVEAALVAHHSIEEAAVFPVRSTEEQTEICAAIMLTPDAEHSTGDVLSYLKGCLPWYAVPGRLTVREKFPRTSTGKIDRRVLSLEETL